MKKIRDAAEKQPQLKTAIVESLEPIQAMLKLKFWKLKLHGEPVATHDALTNDDIEDIFSVLDIVRDENNSPPIFYCKDAKNLPGKLKQLIENHCRARRYKYQVWNFFPDLNSIISRDKHFCFLLIIFLSGEEVWELLVLCFKPPKTATWGTTLASRPNTRYYSASSY